MERYGEEIRATMSRLDEMDKSEQDVPDRKALLGQINTKLQTLEMEARELGFEGRSARGEFLDIAALAVKSAYYAIKSKRS